MINTQKYSMVGVMARLFKLGGRVFDCWRPLAIYAALLTLLALTVKNISLACMNTYDGWCGIFLQSKVFIPLFIFYVLLYVHLFLAFAVDFYDEAFNANSFTIKNLWRRSKEKWQKEMFLWGYLLGYLLPFSLAAKLLLQKANPDWRIEMVYFTLIFAALMFIVLMIRIAASVSRYLSCKKAEFTLIYEQTKGRGYVAVMTFLVLLALLLLSSMRLNIWFDSLSISMPWVSGILIFIKNSFVLAFTALMFVFFRVQDELLKNTVDK